jgi:hypothetical protein
MLCSAVLIALNFLVFLQAYPETSRVDAGCCAATGSLLAKDFSAFYTGVWRLYHDPAATYFNGYVADGEYRVAPGPEPFKYLPSFLIIASPFALLPYQSALTAFDAFQFLLLPFMAAMVYRTAGGLRLRAKVSLAVLVLLLPVPLHAGTWTLSVSYYWQWAEGQAKVLDSFLLLLMGYAGRSGRPRVSGAALGMAFFDPRFALLAMPLFAGCNRRLREASFFALLTAMLSNTPLLLPGVMQGFVGSVLSAGLSTPLYYYAWVPLVSVVSLTVALRDDVVAALRGLPASVRGRGG